jgi:type II secretory pathway pseudopilin PulG
MVILMVAVTILTILVAAALPMWSHARKREKEEELIFRGWQYAEAIRLFQQRQGRYPTRLKELIEVHPRSIRKLWTDPMSENGEWGLVFQGVGAPGLPGQTDTSGNGGGGRNGRPLPGPRAPRGGEQETIGPITGVHSRSTEESIKTMFGEDSYDKWLFTVERLTSVQSRQSQVGFGQGRAAPGQIAIPQVKWIGRPFRPGLEVPQGGGVPGGLPQGTDAGGASDQ